MPNSVLSCMLSVVTLSDQGNADAEMGGTVASFEVLGLLTYIARSVYSAICMSCFCEGSFMPEKGSYSQSS